MNIPLVIFSAIAEENAGGDGVNPFNDTIGVLLRDQMEKIVNRAELIQAFIYDTGDETYKNTKDEQRARGRFYQAGEYTLGIFMDSGEFRIVLFNSDIDTLQTAAAVWYETPDKSHTAVSLRETDIVCFGVSATPMTSASDEERGSAVMKLMMINETEW